MDTIRIRPKAIDRLLDMLRERSQANPVHAIIMRTNVPSEAEDLKQRIYSQFECVEIYVTDFTPVMGLHTGPGLLGIVFHSDGKTSGSSTLGQWSQASRFQRVRE